MLSSVRRISRLGCRDRAAGPLPIKLPAHIDAIASPLALRAVRKLALAASVAPSAPVWRAGATIIGAELRGQVDQLGGAEKLAAAKQRPRGVLHACEEASAACGAGEIQRGCLISRASLGRGIRLVFVC